MMVEQFLAILEPIEKRYRPAEYTDQERTDLYEKFKWMTPKKFEHLAGRVLASDPYRLPTEKCFDKMYEAQRQEYGRTARIRSDCDECGGRGILMCIARTRYGYETSVARCSCDAGQNWPAYPAREIVRAMKNFIRWIGPLEIPLAVIEDQARQDREIREEGGGS